MKEAIKELARMGRRTLGVAAGWALIGPCLLAFSLSARALAAEYLPPNGPERLVVLTAATAGLIEVVRLSHARRKLALRLREVEAKLALPKADEPANS